MAPTDCGERGSALLAVLATVAVLTAVAFATSSAAVGALDRAALRRDSAQAYFLARGGIEAALRGLEAGLRQGRAAPQRPQALRFEFEGGAAEVSLTPAGAKLNVNRMGLPMLAAVLESAGARPGAARQLAEGIAAYRDRLRQGGLPSFWPAPAQLANPGPGSSFRRPAASIQMVEELLSVPGMHPDLLYGSYEAAQGRPLRRVPGLLHYLRTDGPAAVNINAAAKPVLAACGLSAALTDRILAAREGRPLQVGDAILAEVARQGARVPFSVSDTEAGWTLEATGRLGENRATRRAMAVAKPDSGSGRLLVQRWFELDL
ncbi:MAG: type II secretion system protein GspK [Bryobacterales bacterium]|nr:type II secretion system protein GspK [Bryobacterales bacterium]